MAVALVVARCTDAATTELLRQLDLDLPDELDDLIRGEVLHRLALDLAMNGYTPHDERTQP